MQQTRYSCFLFFFRRVITKIRRAVTASLSLSLSGDARYRQTRCKSAGSLFCFSFSGFHPSSVVPIIPVPNFLQPPLFQPYTLSAPPPALPSTHSRLQPLSPMGNNLGYDSPTSVSPHATFNIKLATSNIKPTWNSREMPVLRLVCF